MEMNRDLPETVPGIELLPPLAICERARQARDARYDGRFFVAVKTTGIYCRPICPAKIPAAKNVCFFATAAAAADAGFRPCLRCRPETAPGSAAWRGSSAVVNRALGLIEAGALDGRDIDAFAGRFGLSARHLNRLFAEHVGASPLAIVNTRRLQMAKQLIDQTSIPMRDVALAAGYGSVRQFNDAVRDTWQRTPRELRRLHSPDSSGLTLRLNARAPFDGGAILDWLEFRATPGIECVAAGSYCRKLEQGCVTITPQVSGIVIHLEEVEPAAIPAVVDRARRLFDLACDPDAVKRVLQRDATLSRLVRKNPGQRIPGCWDPFELAVRCLLGQQVSVKAANTLMLRLVEKFGPPTADSLARAPLERIGLPGRRAASLRALSAAMTNRELDFTDPRALRERLLGIQGIGPWTAEYICLRAAGDPDAFPAGDLVLQKAVEPGSRLGERELMQRAEAWRPWRGYAALHLWRSMPAGG